MITLELHTHLGANLARIGIDFFGFCWKIVYMTTHSERPNTHKEFRLRLGRGLINNFTSRKKIAPVFKTKKGGATAVPLPWYN